MTGFRNPDAAKAGIDKYYDSLPHGDPAAHDHHGPLPDWWTSMPKTGITIGEGKPQRLPILLGTKAIGHIEPMSFDDPSQGWWAVVRLGAEFNNGNANACGDTPEEAVRAAFDKNIADAQAYVHALTRLRGEAYPDEKGGA